MQEEPLPQSAEAKKDLLKNDFSDLDIGSFKIKKKKKAHNEEEGTGVNKNDVENLDFNDKLKYIKVDEMNVIKVSLSPV